MEIKVRDLGSEEAKSTQEIEKELLEKHEQSQGEEIKIEEPLVLHKKDISEKATKETKQETKSSLTFGV